MNKLNSVLFAAAICFAAAPALAQQAQVARRPAQYQMAPAQELQVAPAPQQPSATDQAQPQTSVVAGARAWQATGVTVHAGGQLQISATGQWSAVRQSTTFAAANVAAPPTDANGYPNTAGGEGTLLPSANRGALIGKIGEDGAPFLVGAAFNQTAPADGMLFLSMNDIANGFEDNSGRLAVSITAAAPQPPPVEEPPPPAPEVTPTPVPSTTPNDQTGAGPSAQAPTTRPGPSGITNMIIIAVGALIALFVAAQIFRPARRSPDRRQDVNVPQVSARIANSGIADQALTIRVRGR